MRPGFFMPAPFFIVGPTAVGKSRLAVEVAARFDAEILGADAFQIYAGFGLLTAKPSLAQQRGVPHHLIGAVAPTQTYNVARYLEDAQVVLALVAQRGNPAIVVGGTGLYVKALTHGLSSLPEADPGLRAKLDALDTPALLARLHGLDPAAANTVDVHNRRRLIRAIEVCLLTGRPFSSHQSLWSQVSSEPATNGVFLTRSKADLDERIERRVTTMFAQGVVEEVKSAHDHSLSPTASRMIGYEAIRKYLSGQQSLRQCQDSIRLATRQYAKRQVTWFQREKCFEKIDLTCLADESDQVAAVSSRFEAYSQRARPRSED